MKTVEKMDCINMLATVVHTTTTKSENDTKFVGDNFFAVSATKRLDNDNKEMSKEAISLVSEALKNVSLRAFTRHCF